MINVMLCHSHIVQLICNAWKIVYFSYFSYILYMNEYNTNVCTKKVRHDDKSRSHDYERQVLIGENIQEMCILRRISYWSPPRN